MINIRGPSPLWVVSFLGRGSRQEKQACESKQAAGLLLLKQEVNRATGFLVRAERETMRAFSSLPLHEAFLDFSLQELRPGKG